MNFFKRAQLAMSSMSGSMSTSASVAAPASRRAKVQDTRTPFDHPLGRFRIGSLDDAALTVTAQYNPDKLELTRTVNWKQHDARDNRPEWLRQRTGREGFSDDVEYTGAEGRELTFNLIFDGVEQGESVEGEVRALEEMACVRDADSISDAQRRPHRCVVVYGHEGAAAGLGKFRCVIKSLKVSYSYFSNSGAPLRANVSITVREAFGVSGFSNDMDKAAADRAESRRKQAEARASRTQR